MKFKNVGFIKLPRTILEWQWYDDINTTKLMVHLLLKANFQSKQWRGHLILPNQLITSYEKLAIETGLTVSKVRTAISKLKRSNDIRTQPHNKFTKIEICAPFFIDIQNDNQIALNKQTNDKPVTTTKNAKEIEKIKKEFKEEVFSHTQYSNSILNSFFSYWTEVNAEKTKMRFQDEKFWEIEKRIKKWAAGENSQTKNNTIPNTQDINR